MLVLVVKPEILLEPNRRHGLSDRVPADPARFSIVGAASSASVEPGLAALVPRFDGLLDRFKRDGSARTRKRAVQRLVVRRFVSVQLGVDVEDAVDP